MHQTAICDNNPDNIPTYTVLRTVIPRAKFEASLVRENHGGSVSCRTHAKSPNLRV